MHYTGMGLSSDQSIKYSQNKTLAESRTNGVAIYLFKSNDPRKYIYTGRVKLARKPYYAQELDENNNQRLVVKLPLKESSKNKNY